MDFFLQDPNEVRLPPEEVRLLEVKVTPQPGSPRVKIYLELTPFKKRPNLEVTIYASSGKKAAHSSILETMLPKLEFTLHLRQVEPGSEYTIESVVYYQKLPEPSDEPVDVPLPEPMVVDRRKTTFVLPVENTHE
jgi:hypothetical protein